VYKTILPAGLVCLALAAVVTAETPPEKAPPPPPAPTAGGLSVEQLIEQLGDEDFRKRDAAVQLLQEQGVQVLPALRKVLGHPDPEVRKRVAELIPLIETRAVLAPRRVTLKVENKPLKAIFDEITRQTQYKIECGTNGPEATYSFDFKDLTFWEAIDKISQQAGLVLQQGYGDSTVRLYQQDGFVPYVHYDGAFRFVPTGFHQYRSVNFGGGRAAPVQRSESLSFNFMVFAEPKLPLLGVGEVKLSAAYDTEKNSMLLPANPNADEVFFPGGFRGRLGAKYGGGNRTFCMQTQANLTRPSEKASGLKVIRGSIPLTLLAEQKAVVVTDKVLTAKGKKATVGTTTIDVQDVTEMANKQIQIKLSISEENKDNPNDYSWMNSLYQRIELQDDKGNKFQPNGTTWGNNAPNHVEITLTYGAPGNVKDVGPPAKLIFQQWTTMQHLVSFEFKDLPLP
jgi:hypothetical protein